MTLKVVPEGNIPFLFRAGRALNEYGKPDLDPSKPTRATSIDTLTDSLSEEIVVVWPSGG